MRKLGFEEIKKLSKAVQLVSDKAKTQRLNFSGSKNLCLFYHPRGWHYRLAGFLVLGMGRYVSGDHSAVPVLAIFAFEENCD